MSKLQNVIAEWPATQYSKGGKKLSYYDRDDSTPPEQQLNRYGWNKSIPIIISEVGKTITCELRFLYFADNYRSACSVACEIIDSPNQDLIGTQVTTRMKVFHDALLTQTIVNGVLPMNTYYINRGGRTMRLYTD